MPSILDTVFSNLHFVGASVPFVLPLSLVEVPEFVHHGFGLRRSLLLLPPRQRQVQTPALRWHDSRAFGSQAKLYECENDPVRSHA